MVVFRLFGVPVERSDGRYRLFIPSSDGIDWVRLMGSLDVKSLRFTTEIRLRWGQCLSSLYSIPMIILALASLLLWSAVFPELTFRDLCL